VITGVHAIIYSEQAQAARAFFRDVLGWESVDAGQGWLIFALPPTELAIHPASGADRHELYLMCEDLDATIDELRRKGVEIVEEVTEQRWGRTTAIGIPGGGRIALYEPAHASPLT
jgi:predicted enzyme related to lactoylglutathione lyase